MGRDRDHGVFQRPDNREKGVKNESETRFRDCSGLHSFDDQINPSAFGRTTGINARYTRFAAADEEIPSPTHLSCVSARGPEIAGSTGRAFVGPKRPGTGPN